MKKYYIHFLLLILSFSAKAQTSQAIITGDVVTIDSKILKEKRTAWVYSPGKTGEKYPVIYVLDGESHFKSVVAMVTYLSEANVIPPMIVVGILHPDRVKDLTPTDEAATKNSGGGEPFMLYVKNELMPKIESAYTTAPYRILAGHSLGGLTVINALVHHPGLFNAYVAIDASIWWDQQRLLKECRPVLSANNYAGKRLFLAIANRMEKGIDTAAVRKDTTDGTELIRYNLQLMDLIKSNRQNQLIFGNKYYPDDNHSSVSFAAEYDAIRFIFDYYKFTVYNSYFDNSNIRLDSLITAHYQNVSRQLGYVIKPAEGLLNNLAYTLLRKKDLTRAKYLFILYADNYPESSNAFDSLGDFYMETGDKVNAIKSFQKALAIKEVPETRKKLKQLLNK